MSVEADPPLMLPWKRVARLGPLVCSRFPLPWLPGTFDPPPSVSLRVRSLPRSVTRYFRVCRDCQRVPDRRKGSEKPLWLSSTGSGFFSSEPEL
jgi:hypothetical protein